MTVSKRWVKHDTGILLIAIFMFVLPLGYLFLHSRTMVRQEAIKRAESVLDNTALRVTNYVIEVETATRNLRRQVLNHMNPDSLLAYSRVIVEENPNVSGCSVTTEPNYFPQLGCYFSAYSVMEGDSVTTVREGEYEYYDKVWYKSSRDAKKAVWVDPYNDYAKARFILRI